MHYPKNKSTDYLRKLSFGVLALLAACSQQEPEPSNIFAAVDNGNSAYVRAWIKNGGNPDARDSSGQSLVYIATGPHGGHAVLIALLEGGADPNLGLHKYTPLMNAANWADLDSVRSLLTHGANPNLRNEDGKIAMELVGKNAGYERPVIQVLQWATFQSNQ